MELLPLFGHLLHMLVKGHVVKLLELAKLLFALVQEIGPCLLVVLELQEIYEFLQTLPVLVRLSSRVLLFAKKICSRFQILLLGDQFPVFERSSSELSGSLFALRVLSGASCGVLAFHLYFSYF
ncbi:hypothetical protein FGO68_gene15971 [Halteria grandinella]|uniref:Uncharacterized protein n=1 Tax=Halteria grandinella TaxID=5974 RepID=A0A8J8NLL7_HALGN|nr:hypothetical protein FGO68_gene15971 [Halteria grandinella]